MKKIFLILVCAAMIVSCVREEEEYLNQCMYMVSKKGVCGVMYIGGDVMLPMVYDSIVKVDNDSKYNYCQVIAYKQGRAELWDLTITDIPEGPADYYYSTAGAYDHLGKVKTEKLAEGRNIERMDRRGYNDLVVITGNNGKKSVYGSNNKYAPFDEIYPTMHGYIFKKDGLFGVSHVPAKYKRVYVIRLVYTTYYLFSKDGVNCDVYTYGRKDLEKLSEITIAEVEDFKQYAESHYSEYSYSGYKSYDAMVNFRDKLDGWK